jgi:hypothetical protein
MYLATVHIKVQNTLLQKAAKCQKPQATTPGKDKEERRKFTARNHKRG